MTTLKIRLILCEEALGMSPSSKQIYTDYIASQAPDASTVADEVASLGSEEVVQQQTTIFPRDKQGRRFVYDYQLKGLFKDACGMLSRLVTKEEVEGKSAKKKTSLTESGKITAYKKVIDGLIFVQPRKIFFDIAVPDELEEDMDKDGIRICQRPLRASTPQGERIALASSEAIPIGSKLTFDVIVLDDAHVPAVLEWLDYGLLRGFGQWRNSGKGRFMYEVLDKIQRKGISFNAANGAVADS